MAITVVGIPLMGTSIPRRFMQSKYIQCLRRAGAEVRIHNPAYDLPEEGDAGNWYSKII